MADGFDTNDVDYLRQVDRNTGAVTPAARPRPAPRSSRP